MIPVITAQSADPAPPPLGESPQEGEEDCLQSLVLFEAMGLTMDRVEELTVGPFDAYRSVMDEQGIFSRADLLRLLAQLATSPEEIAFTVFIAIMDEPNILQHITTERLLKRWEGHHKKQKEQPLHPAGYG